MTALFLQRLRLQLATTAPTTSPVFRFGQLRRGVADKATRGTDGEQQIYNKLDGELQPARLAVTDSSGGCGSMYVVEIEAERFRGLSRVKQTKLVTSLLKQEIQAMHGIRQAERCGMLGGLGRAVRALDGFPKVDGAHRATTATGGVASILVLLLMAYMVGTEISEYVRYKQVHRFVIDTAVQQDVQINMDVTVAMPCALLRVDVVDASGDASNVRNSLQMRQVSWTRGAMAGSSALGAKDAEESALMLRQGHAYPHVHDIIADASRRRRNRDPQAKAADTKPVHGGETIEDMACRIVGTVRVNKVSGLFHITAPGHGHMGGGFVPHRFLNFTHAVDELSFGPLYPDIVNPLDATHHRLADHDASVKYFVSVIPTTYIAPSGKRLATNQYAVNEFRRSHHHSETATTSSRAVGIPGIFFEYSFEPIAVEVREIRSPLLVFLARLCAALSGPFVTVGVVHQIVLGTLGRPRRSRRTSVGIITPTGIPGPRGP
ncbi:hypothetical protein IW140_002154 [Coemansia sp. RSA 1813]|nr:hypothetical protein EV178_001303 [Coemansia sp. RSA 1646]KAJ1772653.1 hypothetical protein LPJ74_001369 [Coemansia sp. RSA 1843]KAJ2090205.1 hypothetical protein IW138_002837 [Coemansia sp. RSA 986]KAJ2214611.1 hypothetical protein EV179_002870 [Coemansia sp. RSA 487]KAJ2570728.1 hypothetical protein IW140_002154 [Coemansia sp. RSA 1813]